MSPTGKTAPLRRLAAAKPAPKTARLFANGASQAVRLPKEFRMPGKEVSIWKEGGRVVMEPLPEKPESLADVIERFYEQRPEGLQIGRSQPAMQERDWTGVFEPAPITARKPGKTRSRR